MSHRKKEWIRWSGRAAVLLGFVAGVVAIMLWLAGKFEPKVPSVAATPAEQGGAVKGHIVAARLVRIPVVESAVGTIHAVHETTIGSKLLARVVDVNLKAGQKVREGDVLVRLDDTDLRAKLQQANAAVTVAEAVHTQAAGDERRYAELVEKNAVSRQQYEKSVMESRSSDAQLRRAQEAVREVQAMLDWATIRAPMDAVVVDKKVDVGDTV